MQALAGWMTLTGPPDGPPEKTGLSLVDLSAGYVSVIAVLAGLWRARRDGVGCDCDISLYETALAELLYVGTWAATEGYVPARRPNSAHPSIVPFQNFRTSDGWIVVACPKPKFWELLCAALELPELAGDARFADFGSRDANRQELLALLEPRLAARSTAEWIRCLTDAGVPCAEVKDVPAALEDPQAVARDAILSYEHPRLGEVRQVASPLRLDVPLPDATPSPERGAHTREVLESLCGYTAEQLDRLARDGVFGDALVAQEVTARAVEGG
jgi:crotonobetainyl-CoA:carnitine CoA-transferase CaiB-like acyl-CoA transferase